MANVHHFIHKNSASINRKGKKMGGGILPTNGAFFADGKFKKKNF